MSGLENDLIPYGMALGNRAHLSGLNIVGLTRRGFARDDIHKLRRAYRLLFADEGTLKERVDDVALEFATHPIVQEIVAFIREGEKRTGGKRSLVHAARWSRGMSPAGRSPERPERTHAAEYCGRRRARGARDPRRRRHAARRDRQSHASY